MNGPVALRQPTVRGDATLLAASERGGWHGYESDWLLPAAGIVVDAMLSGVLEVSGRRVLGLDRRRIVPGPAAGDDGLPEPVARLARRLTAVEPEAPYEWVRHTATFAPQLVLAELVADGAGAPSAGWWTPSGRTAGLVDKDHQHYAAARRRVQSACDGAADATSGGVATAILLQIVEALHKVVPNARSRAVTRHLRAAQADLPPAVRAMLETLQQRKAREDNVQH